MNSLQQEPTASSHSSSPSSLACSADSSLPGPAKAADASLDGRSVRWESHREERRRSLIQATRRAIHRLGADASMEEIAVTAGTSKSVFYRYFGDKSGLRHAVGAVVIRQMQQTIAAARQGASSPREGVTAMISAYLQMAQTSPNVYFFATLPDDGEARPSGELTGFFDSVTAMITEPMGHLLGDPNSPLVDYWPQAAIGMVRTAGELWLQTPDLDNKPDFTTMAGQISAWLFDGVGQLVPLTPPHRSTTAAEGKS
ncbi:MULTISPECIES: TetR/AcrR family transcriptional regulator [Arthrobacter]|uniref:TetR family transcriptional regulator n=1 Tax=Arthrobacter psychrochitiniphilus TaxID=291045 RepID=A0A2V3DR15_9MICC|nr:MULTISPECIES: TetR family transcriptional regulator [Arthrobacter]NYG17077.1 AcrR family transcriptional regulator [Arthrobacter psychrochitiniphilus]PXA64716.1 TetR family transcriptional regulator [Arthrobacter psychrochitiniphilus]